jgi:hypothetical protein
MTNIAHFFGGYLALDLTKKYWSIESFTPDTTRWLLIYGLILSLAIDLDVLITRGITNHHKQLTHYPFFWLVISAVIFLLGLLFKQKILQAFAIVTLVSSWTHLALDLVGVTMGIHALWPFSTKEFSITPLKTDFATEKERIEYILKSPVMWVGDSIVVVLGLLKMIFK